MTATVCRHDFRSDNGAGVHPAVIAAMAAANNAGADAGYDGDRWSLALDQAFSDLFAAPVTALWLPTGTAANALALALLCPPYRAIVTHEHAHIHCDEAGAPEFFTGGAKLLTVGGPDGKLTPALLADRLAAIENDVHRAQPAAVSITNATEYGQIYTPEETRALGALAQSRGLAFHLDGARIANACAAQAARLADLSWRAGVNAMSFGFIKNGGMTAEALILFDPDQAAEARVRRKRAGLLSAKGRFFAVQLLALIEDGLWLANARAANAAARTLSVAAGDRLVCPVAANALFVRLSPEDAAHLRAQGFGFYDWGPGEARFMTAWDTAPEAVDALSTALSRL